jgi:hypothetical protein
MARAATMNDNPDIVDELNFHAQHAEASERVLHLLAEAAGTVQRYRVWQRENDDLLRDYERRLEAPRAPAGYAPSPADLVGVDTSLLFEEVIRRLNYDGNDTNSLTVGEIRRALP